MTGPARRPTSAATDVSLTRMAGATVAVGLMWLATWMVIAPPEAIPGPWRTFAALAGLMAAASAGAAARPQWRGSKWTPAVASLVLLLTLSDVKSDSDLVGWWASLELAAYLTLAAAIALPIGPGVVLSGVVVVIVGVAALAGASGGNVFVSAVGGPAALTRVAILALAIVVSNYLLRRSASRTDAVLAASSERRERIEADERQRRSDRRARWFLHDSGMNSLEAVVRGVPAGREAALRERCAVDAERWLEAVDAPAGDIAAAFTGAIDGAEAIGLRIDAEFDVSGVLDGAVVSALADAAAEALRNSAKHAGTGTAALHVRIGQGTAEVVIRDRGAGFDPGNAAPGLGLTRSIAERLDDAGGTAVIESAPGRGTVVRLLWPASQHPEHGDAVGADPEVLDLPDELARLAWLPIAFIAVGAGISMIVNWSSVAVPWLLLVGGLLLSSGCWWLVRRWRRGTVDRVDVAILISTVALVTLAMPIANPFCSAATGPPLVPDGRLVAVALLGVLLASWRTTLVAVVVALAALAVAAAMWLRIWPPCSLATVPTGIGTVVVAIAGLLLGRAVRTQQTAAWGAFVDDRQARLAQVRLRVDQAVRAQWGFAAVGDARQMLRAIGNSTIDIRDDSARRRAHHIAVRLRSAVHASELPSDLGTAIMRLVEDGRTNGFPVTLDGDLGDGAQPDDPAVRLVADALLDWWRGLPSTPAGAALTLSGFGGVRSVLVRVDLPAADDADDVGLAADVPTAGGAPEFTEWTDGSQRWWQAEWCAGRPVEIG